MFRSRLIPSLFFTAKRDVISLELFSCLNIPPAREYFQFLVKISELYTVPYVDKVQLIGEFGKLVTEKI